MMFGARLIGHSVSRCVNDVLSGKVQDNDIKLVIGATRFDMNPAGVEKITDMYINEGSWDREDRAKIIELLNRWIETGRLHQPRNYGGFAQRSPYTWSYSLPEPRDMSPAAKEAWESFLTIDRLSREKSREEEYSDALDVMAGVAI